MSNLASKSVPQTATSIFSENWNILRGDLRTATTLVKKALGATTRLSKAKKACVGAAQDSYVDPRDPGSRT